VFGRKDYQQWKVIERMTADLDMRVRVVGHPIVRESDGLALSSRNRYLDPGNRRRARGISQTLAAARRAFEVDGARDAASLAALARNRLETQVDRIDYVAVTDPDSLEAAEGQVTRALLAIAAHVGSTRLIDNTVLGEPDPALPSLDSTG
jgi:pantoate--beta-alanine ligase